MPRWLEFSLALMLIIILIPLFCIVALASWIMMGAPILFRQQRPGLYGSPFTLYKFRTMNNGTANDQLRLNKFGNFLRKSSIDELPQLINILKGDISFVGPRPLLMEYLTLYNLEQARRHLVKPGITGWAQVNGRNAITWEQKFILDGWYVDNKSFALDLKIMLLTVCRVLQVKNIGHGAEPIMPKFTGTNTGVQQ